jgi:uncharacterized membrane protein HdeD (DUF308 family)
MVANHIHDALRQVNEMRTLALDRARFRGYSGIARMVGACAALLGAIVLSRPAYPAAPSAHLAGWAAVLATALTVNYGGLLVWFWRDPSASRDGWQLLPALDAVPALAAGALLSAALVLHGQYDLLFGTWMGMYGLAHAPYRRSLPPANLAVGIFYGLAGALCLFHPSVSFTHPWPMGVVFGAGELAGGMALRTGWGREMDR